MHSVLKFQNGLCTFALQALYCVPKLPLFTCIFAVFLLYQDISVWKEENLKGMVVLQITAAANVIKNMLHTLTFGWLLFFFYRKCVSEKIWCTCINSAWLLKLSWPSTRCEVLVLYLLTHWHEYTDIPDTAEFHCQHMLRRFPPLKNYGPDMM